MNNKSILVLSALVTVLSIAATTNIPPVVSIPTPSPQLDAESPSLMPGKATNAPAVSGTNGPIQLQSKPQPVAPTFADGVRLGFMVARRNQDLNDLNAVFQYAAMFWNQEQAQRRTPAAP